MSNETKPIADRLRESIEAEREADVAEDSIRILAVAKTIEALEPKSQFGEVPIEKQMFSLSYVCGLFQIPPTVVRSLAKDAGVQFAASVNDVPYFDGVALLEMGRYLRNLPAESDDA